ncbi:MAG TPA: MFS transporter [Candidatus Hydrogenedens sp.]|nr:MFS transporter [Candidatus Hydrogenedens sp.]HOK08067.1 MFS transporter [Candidatus Hydrogenedens sp.]HOL19339.1 MFS transporter [Candidatus Hydrogenedens sp.]HPP57939.1 MFS transporter [Candidatus Hydrogenedens sp.]
MSQEIKPTKLFVGSCTALVATAMTFAVLSAIMNPLKQQFLLTNEQAGWIGGAGLWGFPISILIFGPLCSVLGIRFLLRLAFVFFVSGISLMIFANGFWMLFFGALTIAFANGLVEGACNPLVATLYPDKKTQKLNQFHVWFPGGIVIGGLLCYFLDKVGITSWQLKVGSILIPTFAYAVIMLMENFPETERAQSGVSFGEMIKETLGRPLFILLFICMMMTASVELGPNRWIPAVLESGGIPGMLVLVWTSLLMALLRQFSGPVVNKLSPTGMLLSSAILSGIGLYMLSFANSYTSIFIADTVFALGVCYFWPTMLGVASERVPKGGEFALALLGVAGNVAVGLITIPLMGRVADYYGHEKFELQKTIAIVQEVSQVFPDYKKGRPEREQIAIDNLINEAKNIENYYKTNNKLPEIKTANLLRAIQLLAPENANIGKSAKELLNPADLYGGRIAFRYVSALCIILVIVFGLIYGRDVMQGGYKAEKIVG